MELQLPSMVQRSGDTLIVRSVVSGNQLYMDQGVNNSGTTSNSATAHNQQQQQRQQIHHNNASTSDLEQQFERYRAAAVAQAQQQHYLQQQQQQQQQQNAVQHQAAAAAALELKDEGLPQCKIKRNYSCSYCTYFTQNPRYHLTHLRDVHGEKIVINKCKLCLYASRHFQKLVRHMKMVHGCTDGIAGGHGQARGKRGMSREARKRKLEQSVGANLGGPSPVNVGPAGVAEMPTLEQVQRELELQGQKLQRDLQAFNKQQEEQKQQQQLANNAAEAIFAAAAYERQIQAQRDRDLEARQARNAYDQDAIAAEARRQSPTNHSSSSGFQMPAHLHSISHSRNLELTPSPNSSAASPSGTAAGTPPATHTPTNNNNTTSAALSLASYAEEPAQNRLLKCSLCDFTTLYRVQLIDHELDEHCKTKFFRCEKCSYVTHIKARFSKHVKYHSMPMIKCVTCDFRTPYKWNLDRHMKNHGGAGPFKCAACDFTADIKQSLTVHEMNHHVPPVGHAAGMSLARRRNKVGGTDLLCGDDFLSDSAEMLEDHYNNNNLDEYDEALVVVGNSTPEVYGKKCKYEEDEPTDLSQKGGSSDTSSVHNQAVNTLAPKAKRPMPNLIPIPKGGSNVLNLSKDLAASRSSLTEIASIFFNEKQLNEMLRPLDKSDAAQLSPTTTITSTSSLNSRSLLQRRSAPGGSFFDKLKSSALTSGGPSENLICPCGHMAKCLSESIIHRKTCNSSAIALVDDDIEEEEEHDDADGRLEIDFVDEDDKQSHSALNLSVTGSTRCQHCRHRCKSSADLLNHLKLCTEAGRCGNESYDSMMSGESSGGGRGCGGTDSAGEQQHPMENRVFIWNKMPRSGGGTGVGDNGSQCSEGQPGDLSGGNGNASNEENSYYGVETAPGYGEVTKKMTPEEEAANSSLKKVYKCPHCSFWASTASRFHVHIVGHLNKKPFECSLCSYRSNWRWDITKHIRLKTIRDPSHKSARVLMNDETGRRNYTKYNKYITLMKVTEEDGDPKLMKSGEMTPNQVASLAFLNDFNKSVSSSGHLNGSKEDITLERVVTSKSSGSADVGENQPLSDVIRLPLLATMMNAAMAQQKEQHEQQQQHTTLITPSVTISAVKRSPPPLMKPSDDVVTDYKQEGNEKRTFYKCRKCSFRHVNRDAVLAHVKIHYQDANYPIVTATMTTSPKSSTSQQQQQQQQQQHSTHLQVVNSSMKKIFAAMCLSQQQQQQQQHNSNSPSKQQQQQQHSLLLNASPLSGLALALAGKSPTKTTASILEHGEQKSSQNEASAQPLTSPSIPASASSSSHNSVAGLGGVAGGGSHHAPPSLQHLLTSPRGTYSAHHSHTHNQQNAPTIAGAGGSHNCKNNNNNLVMGLGAAAIAAFNSPTTTTQQQQQQQQLLLQHHHQQQQQQNQISQSPIDSPTSTIVTTLPTTPTSTATKNNNNCNHLQMGLIGASSSSSSAGGGGGQHIAADSVCIGGVLYGSNSSTLTCNITTTTSTPPTTTTTSTSCNLLLSSAANPPIAAAAAPHLSPSQSPSASTFNNNTNNNNLLANDSERRDPSPYRCGHCHQVSNWKHVIQRHCRLKHAGDIRIETLDRSALNDRNAVPTYRPLGNGASNETNNFGINLKTLQQQQQQQQPNLSNNNNSVLMNKNDHLLHSPLGGSAAAAAANAASTPQDLQAAAAAFLAFKVATAGNVGAGSASNEDLLQLQQNDQIEITRLPAAAASNLAQLLESSGAVHATANAQQQQQQQNSKCKQQKCPLCPYISESKSQMNYHISLHKPTQYECSKCTFVCAKKQHLSNHMRSVHQQHINSSTGTSVGGLNLDFSVALQLAAAAQAQQDSSTALSAAHAMDLTGMKNTHSSAPPPHSTQHLPPEYQFKMISYCSKCPARYAQKHNEAHNANTSAKQELAEHFKCHASSHHHNASSSNTFKCEFCDFKAAHETLIQTHRYVHTQHYQEKFNELYRNCKEDVHNAAPKLMQITSTKNLQAPETVWIVDTELMAEQTKQQQQQSSSISSSTNANFDNANSLLKKQLESGPAPIPPTTAVGRNTPSPTHKPPQDDDSSNTPSTSASIATSDLAADLAASSGAESVASPAPLEKCQHCPYETTNTSLYKAHLQHHICVSNHKEAFTCEHCDYTDHEQQLIEEHTRIHFNAMEKLKSVAFFTSYDNLELSVEQPVATMEDESAAAAKEEREELPINHLNIKQEHNNNNEENAVNENTRDLQEEKTNDVDAEEGEGEEEGHIQPPVETSEPLRKPCNKIILYKNDGCLAIKKDPSLSSAAVGGSSDNISDRLRRRISNSRSSNSHHMNGHHSETHEQHYQQQQQTQQQSHKTILVNAKTGQVISRN